MMSIAATPELDPPPFRVLVCDDQDSLRKAISQVLAMVPLLQFTAEAADGPGCLEQVAHTRPHVLILDVNMPGGGPQVPRAVKDIDPDVYILVYSGRQDFDTQNQMLAAGADEYVVKTGRLAPLVQALSHATTHYHRATATTPGAEHLADPAPATAPQNLSTTDP